MCWLWETTGRKLHCQLYLCHSKSCKNVMNLTHVAYKTKSKAMALTRVTACAHNERFRRHTEECHQWQAEPTAALAADSRHCANKSAGTITTKAAVFCLTIHVWRKSVVYQWRNGTNRPTRTRTRIDGIEKNTKCENIKTQTHNEVKYIWRIVLLKSS